MTKIRLLITTTIDDNNNDNNHNMLHMRSAMFGEITASLLSLTTWSHIM